MEAGTSPLSLATSWMSQRAASCSSSEPKTAFSTRRSITSPVSAFGSASETSHAAETVKTSLNESMSARAPPADTKTPLFDVVIRWTGPERRPGGGDPIATRPGKTSRAAKDSTSIRRRRGEEGEGGGAPADEDALGPRRGVSGRLLVPLFGGRPG